MIDKDIKKENEVCAYCGHCKHCHIENGCHHCCGCKGFAVIGNLVGNIFKGKVETRMKYRECIPCQKCKMKVSWNVHHLRIYCDVCGSEIKDHQINPGHG